MTIVHIDFSGPYTEGMTYQENLLPDAMAKEGHKVYMLVPNYEWDQGSISKVKAGVKQLDSGVEIRRYKLAFDGFLGNDFLSRKLRIVPKIYDELTELSPDIIMIHCPQTLSVYAIVKYIKKHNKVTMVIDIHSDYNNSAQGFISKHILHRLIYRNAVKKAECFSKKVYYLTSEMKDFYLKEYKGDLLKMKFLPLGGNVLTENKYKTIRSRIRKELGIDEDTILFLHSGKITKEKKTDILIEGFIKAECKNGILIIIGSATDDMKQIIKEGCNRNEKIKYLGWKTGEELGEYLCATDVYCQPGSQSATLQNAICNRCALIIYPHRAYIEGYIKDNAVCVKSSEEIANTIRDLSRNPNKVREMKKVSEGIAKEKLDYREQSKMIIGDCVSS